MIGLDHLITHAKPEVGKVLDRKQIYGRGWRGGYTHSGGRGVEELIIKGRVGANNFIETFLHYYIDT